MSIATPQKTRPEALRRLVARFDPGRIDVPGGSARIRLYCDDDGCWDAVIEMPGCTLEHVSPDLEPDATLDASDATWAAIAGDVQAGMKAFRTGRLKVRENLHLGVGFLAATSDVEGPEALSFQRIDTPNHELSILAAGEGEPVICIHGLGASKASFLPTVSALASQGYRVIAVDLPGFGDSHKPARAPYNAPWFASAVLELIDELDLGGAHLVGNSMGGRVAIETGLVAPDQIGKVVLLSPALAWLRDRGWKWLLRLPLPQLGFIQPTPRWAVEPIVRRIVPGATAGWTAAGVDEFLRSYLTPNGRVAFYEAARNIYMDEPHGDEGFWPRLEALSPETMFVWGRQDTLVPISFMHHVEKALPAARHVELNCGHVPQLEMPERTHREIVRFFRSR
jgi:pimeloyl-ACP methyl ester carboxylesterase